MKSKIVISDDVISLLWTCEENENINDFSSAHFKIILNENKKCVGTISYELGMSTLNNVTYRIYQNYRKNGYATRALSLLKEIVKKCNFRGNKNLYLTPTNVFSEKVILNNDGELTQVFAMNDDYSAESDVCKVYEIKIGN